ARRALLARHLVNREELARRHTVLLSPGRDHGFHVRPFFVPRPRRAPIRAQVDALRQQSVGAPRPAVPSPATACCARIHLGAAAATPSSYTRQAAYERRDASDARETSH